MIPSKLLWMVFVVGMWAMAACQPGQWGGEKESVEQEHQQEGGDQGPAWDSITGLVIDEHLNVVKANCLGCHSSQLIVQNRATRDDWLKTIRWMQATQNLWDLGQNEKPILDYLAKNYAPEARFRRKPLEVVEWYVLDD